MGIILDSTVLISAERRGLNVEDIAPTVRLATLDELLEISVVTLGELAVGIVKAESEKRRASREQFIRDVQGAFSVVPINSRIAIRSGLLRAMLQQQGQAIDLPDLLIAATALELDYAVGTANVRHFRRVPGLRVVEL